MSRPSKRICPPSTSSGRGSSRSIDSIVSVLPEPLSPTTPTFSPGQDVEIHAAHDLADLAPAAGADPHVAEREHRYRCRCGRAQEFSPKDVAARMTRREGASAPATGRRGRSPGVIEPRMLACRAPVQQGTEALMPEDVR